MKIQKIALRIVFENFRVISLKILKEKTHVQFIHLYLFHLQATTRNRLKKHKHRTLINDFCNRIKNHLVDAREKKRQHDVLTLNELKQQWYEKFQRSFQRTKQRIHNERKFIKRSSTTNKNKFDSRIKRNIRAIFVWRWRKTLLSSVWSCTKN
jgi:hypothetical protein